MARVETNAVEVKEATRRLGEVGRMRGPGRYKTMAEDLQDLIAQGLYDRYVLAQQEPGGARLAALSPRYLDRKVAAGYPATIGVRTGLMLSYEQLRGEVVVGDDNALEMTYGVDETARTEMEWFTEGHRSQHRPPRPGYELDEAIERDIDLLVLDALDRVVTELGGEAV